MIKRFAKLSPFAIAVALIATGCNGAGPAEGTVPCDLENPCAAGLICSGSVTGESFCVIPVVIRGEVFDIADETPVEGALVQAVDINGAAIGTSGESDELGGYELLVPRLQDMDEELVDGVYTLRVQAAAFQEFPTPIRPALPIDVNEAAIEEDVAKGEGGETRLVVDNSLTLLALIMLPGDPSQLGSIRGDIIAEARSGVLVVAEGGMGTFTGFSDRLGDYTIFNVPAGDYDVNGFAAGVQLIPEMATVEPALATVNVDLFESFNPPNSVSGSVQIVNAPGGLTTSVVLALESTFNETAGRGAVPPGLRVGDVAGAFMIEGIPDGRYAVLAAFENDLLVRDPDENISGTDTVFIELPDPDQGVALVLSEGFKVTEALAVIGPGADGPEQVFSTEPVFEWEDDSSEDGYEIKVFDSFGVQVWTIEVGSVSGSATVSVTYAGPPLESGMFYQFRVQSFRDRPQGRSAISATEDLTGVFYYLGTG